jgi:hypothetical protein
MMKFLPVCLTLVLTTLTWANHIHNKAKNNPDIIGLTTRMDINTVDLAFENNGRTGMYGDSYFPNGTNLTFLFDGGLGVTGYINGELRASWIISYVEEWQAAKWGMDPNHPKAKFYEVSSSDGFGSPAYVEWSDAVSLGANFQDLNGDGSFDPNIDRPDILGDKTIWCVYSDSTDQAARTPLYGTLPLGLEIHQTVWAYNSSATLGYQIFFRYRLINADTCQIDSMIFSIWEDPDIGDWADDLIGCDPEVNLGFAYNDGDDLNYGTDPPAFGIQLLQGPMVDEAGSMAYNYRGPYFGTDTIPNKRNLPMTSFMTYTSYLPSLSFPDTVTAARYYQIGGLDIYGNPIDPAHYGIGGTAATNPKYFYSGDPVTFQGWLDNDPRDKRFLCSSGPFQLAIGDTQDIIFAYVLGQGNDALQSITEMRNNAESARNLIGIPLAFRRFETKPAQTFILSQNYPNPFNPTTIIEFTLPKSGEVTLKIYNNLGEAVSTLISATLPLGSYQYEWDASNVASGVYLYRLEVGNFIQTRKMILMK